MLIRTVAFITDSHIDHPVSKEKGVNTHRNWELIAESIKAHAVDFVVFGGDIGDSKILDYFFETFENFGIPYYFILGNHDNYNKLKPYIKHSLATNSNELFYTFADTDYQYIFLDSSRAHVSQFQLNWLKDTIEQSSLHPVIFIHHPVLKVNTRVDIDYSLQNRDDIVTLLNSFDKQFQVFCGHYHTEDYSSQQNIEQYVTPSAAFQFPQATDQILFDTSKFGYRLIRLDSNTVESNVKWFAIP
ncbi:MAG: hypothetical protein CR968_02265 [Flavobacteriia bacterium]|nr:MAG: hypothetical protein CR968_02265 [Flavobacteriia bacterium]